MTECLTMCWCFLLMLRRPPRSTRTDTLFPYTTLFRSGPQLEVRLVDDGLPVAAPLQAKVHAQGADGLVLRRLRQIFASLEHRSEEHTSELQSLMRISYAVFCLKKKKNPNNNL